MTKTAATRKHEHELDIAATPAEVWKAITSAEELVRWFPTGAKTRPGVGGEILYQWGELEGRCRILAWDPPRHLRTGWMEAPATASEVGAQHGRPAAEAARAALAVDWFLEARGAMTHVRLVHSGFAPDAAWDKEFDGTRRGWTFELQALKHYLERHAGKERRATWLRQPVRLAPAEVWPAFARKGPIFRAIELATLAPGDRFQAVRADGAALAGRVLVNHPPLEFAAVLDDGAMLRFGFEDCMGQPEAHVWLATWGHSSERFAAEERAWRAALQQAFAG
jgi:uncharacterized protein YndB with AHSA1/START domain